MLRLEFLAEFNSLKKSQEIKKKMRQMRISRDRTSSSKRTNFQTKAMIAGSEEIIAKNNRISKLEKTKERTFGAHLSLPNVKVANRSSSVNEEQQPDDYDQTITHSAASTGPTNNNDSFNPSPRTHKFESTI